jgi:integrase
MSEQGAEQSKRRAKKRANGEGSIRWSETKKVWIARLAVGTRLDGRPDVREVSHKSQKGCREKLDSLKAQVANGTLSKGDMAGMTVSQFLDRWLATVTPNLRPNTSTRYRGYVEKHFKPGLGTKRLTRLAHDDVQAFLNAKRDEKRQHGKKVKKLAPRTVHHMYVVLGTALTWGVKKGHLAISPMLRVDPPRVPKSEITPLTPLQTTALLDAAEAAADPLLALWTIAAVTGAREDELLGLTWDDVDLDAGTLTIRPNAIRDVKTPRSRRTLGLDDDAVAVLAVHRDRQTFQRQALGEAYADQWLVFASERGTKLNPGNVTRSFKRALRRAGLPESTRLHDLRHGVATMLLEAGESVPTVAEYLGHASPAVTMAVYAHAVPGAGKRAAERLGAILRGARKSPETHPEPSSAAG